MEGFRRLSDFHVLEQKSSLNIDLEQRQLLIFGTTWPLVTFSSEPFIYINILCRLSEPIARSLFSFDDNG
jgi:hypothetical protein